MDTNVDYLGLKLKNPLVVGSCGLSHGRDNLLRMQEAGAGAVILSTRFEEEFAYDIKYNSNIISNTKIYGDAYKYMESHVDKYRLDDYFADVERIVGEMEIPVIGSINCIAQEVWINYVKRFETAGCKAIELIMALRPYDSLTTPVDVERMFTQVVHTTRRVTNMPITIKIGANFTDMARFLQQISWMGISGITLFDNSISMTVDPESMQVVTLPREHQIEDIDEMLRWLMVLSGKTRGSLAAATGIDSSDDVVKALLAGADVVHLSTALYRHGIEYIDVMRRGLEQWMTRHEMENIRQFAGRLSIKGDDASSVMRMMTMRSHLSDLG